MDTIRIHGVGNWKQFFSNEGIELVGRHSRKVVLELNCPKPTRFDLLVLGEEGQDDKVTFLASFSGMKKLEITVPEHAFVQFTDLADSEVVSEVWLRTDDGDNIARIWPEAVTFTQLMERRERSSHLELMMVQMQEADKRIMNRQARERAELKAMRADIDDRNRAAAAAAAAAEQAAADAAAALAAKEGKAEGGQSGAS